MLIIIFKKRFRNFSVIFPLFSNKSNYFIGNYSDICTFIRFKTISDVTSNRECILVTHRYAIAKIVSVKYPKQILHNPQNSLFLTYYSCDVKLNT